MKSLFKYITIFVVTLLVLVTFLTITAKIPKERIAQQIKESQKEFRTSDEVEEVVKRRDYTFLHPYTDAWILNIVYCIDTQHPLASVLEAKYYAKYEKEPTYITYDMTELVENEVEPNAQYLRYWHGSMGIVRILLIFFNLTEIYIFHAIILTILVVLLGILLYKNKAYSLIVALAIGLVMCVARVIPFCLEYTWAFYIMLVASILAVLWKNDRKKLNILFFITGMITCFLDFITTEITTIMIPVVVALMLQIKDNKINNFKESFLFVLQSVALWSISYVGMWLAKWILASVVLNINAFDYVVDNALIRVNGEVLGTTAQNLPWKAISRNLFTLYPLNIQKTIKKLIVIPIGIAIFELIFIRKKDWKKLWVSGLLLLIGLTPYIRYIILANHSYLHYFFTFRSQIITVMAVILAMWNSVDVEDWNKKLDNNNKTT